MAYSYRVTAVDTTGLCATAATACDDAITTGVCNAPPIFAGLGSVTSPGLAGCALDLTWNAADPNCGASATYSAYRSTTSGFTPSPSNRFATGITGTSYRDTSVSSGTTYFYVVRAVDVTNGTEDANTVIRSGTPDGPPVVGSFRTGAELGDPPMTATTGGTRHIGWEWTPLDARTGARSFGSGAFTNECSVITTPPLTLAGVDNAALRFWTRYDTEAAADGGLVQISADGGASWTQLALLGGYPGSFASAANECGYPAGTTGAWELVVP